MTVYSSYHGVMKSPEEPADQNKHLYPWHREQEVCSYSISQALLDLAQQSHTAPSSPEQRPSMQQQRINKSLTRLVPCSTVSQANALNFEPEPDLSEFLCARHMTPLVTAQALHRTIPSLGAAVWGKLEAAPFALLCWSCLSWESLLQEKHKPPMFSPGGEVREQITQTRLLSFTFCLSSIMVEN